MPSQFNELRERLLRSGVAARHVRRYLAELSDHLADLRAEEQRAGLSPADAESAALARIGKTEDLAQALIEQRQFQSLCVRAPWAAFGFVPLFALAGAYFVACMILWSGWQLFLPGAESPFIPLNGVSILYFGVGRMLYFGAPVLIGWGISVIAARQRLNPFWPTAGVALIASIAAATQVQTTRSGVTGSAGKISIDLAPGSSIEAISASLAHAALILCLAILPYLIWRLQRAFFHAG